MRWASMVFTMHSNFDVIVLGLGGMGSSAAFHLQKAGMRVLGIEKYGVAHDKGASHGKSRLIRQAYFEHPDYVPLLKRSYTLWDELEARSGKSLFHKNGVVIYGPKEGGNVLPGVRRSAGEYQIPIEELDAKSAERRFPQLKVPEGFSAIFEPGAGYLEVENCVRTHIEEAEKLGAKLKFGCEVESWDADDKGVSVRTKEGTYHASRLVITAGPWSAAVLKKLGMELKVHRVPLYWFNANDTFSEKKGMPCFAFDMPYGFIYGFPYIEGEGIKLAPHIPGQEVENPDLANRDFDPNELKPVVRCVSDYLKGVGTEPVNKAVCFYTMSKDTHFILDTIPGHSNVVFGAGFSGHGFKFSSVIGEILCELSVTGKTRHPIAFLRRR